MLPHTAGKILNKIRKDFFGGGGGVCVVYYVCLLFCFHFFFVLFFGGGVGDGGSLAVFGPVALNCSVKSKMSCCALRTTSTVSYMDDPGHEEHFKPPARMENTYQLEPTRRFPYTVVKNLMQDALDGYLAEEKYEPELCRQMSKTLSEVCA